MEDSRLVSTSPPLPPSSLPHSCQLCGKMISCRRNLWKHMERVHFTNPAVRCSLCAKMFKNKYALKDHQRIYHGGLSEPSQLAVPSPQHPQPHPPPPHTLLSRILQDPRHQDSCPHPPSPLLSFTPSRLSQDDQEQIQASFPSASPSGIAPPHCQQLSRAHPPEWVSQEAQPYCGGNRQPLLAELHQVVTKSD